MVYGQKDIHPHKGDIRILGTFLGCGPQDPGKDRKTVRVATQISTVSNPGYQPDKSKFFVEENPVSDEFRNNRRNHRGRRSRKIQQDDDCQEEWIQVLEFIASARLLETTGSHIRMVPKTYYGHAVCTSHENAAQQVVPEKSVKLGSQQVQ